VQGYQLACERGIPFVFQIDSDGQYDPQYFFKFWRNRSNFDVIYGKRTRREDGWRRVLAGLVLKLTLFLFGGVNCVDANVPYRLMRMDILKNTLPKIPASFFLANVALAVLLEKTSPFPPPGFRLFLGKDTGESPPSEWGNLQKKPRNLFVSQSS